MATRPINTLAIGAGGCGIEMGLHLSGVPSRVVCYVEREAFAAANLVAKIKEGRLDDAPIWGDAKTFDGLPWRGVVDLITSGYPCQPFSSAGKGLGESDPRHLWPALRRIIREVEPGVCFFENSPRHVKHGLDKVWKDLRDLGFWVEAGTFTAQEVGADHGRERLYILATHPDRYPLRVEPERGEGRAQEALEGDPESRHDGEARTHADADSAGLERTERQQAPGRARLANGGEEHGADADSSGLEGLAAPRLHVGRESRDDSNGLRPRYDGLRGKPWSGGPVPQPSIQRVVDGVAPKLDLCVRRLRNHRLFVVGNGVVPATAALAFDTLGAKF